MIEGQKTVLIEGRASLITKYLSQYFMNKKYNLIEIEDMEYSKMDCINIPIALLVEQSGESNTTNLEKIVRLATNNRITPMQLFIIKTYQTADDTRYSDLINRLRLLDFSIIEIQIIDSEIVNSIEEKKIGPSKDQSRYTMQSVENIVERYLNNRPTKKQYTVEKCYTNTEPIPIIGVVGLGYVGLPVAVGFAKKYKVIGFDVDINRIDALNKHIDSTGELSSSQLKDAMIEFTLDENKLQACNYIIVAVPTPISENNEPNLAFLENASSVIGRNIVPGTIIIYESTVYPGTTEEICIPILEKISGLIAGEDFHVGYSPERINPGDKQHTFKNNNKVVSGQNKHALEKIYEIYQNVLSAKVYKVSSIKVAEASKIIENTQRDINIALMNELSLIFNRMKIDTYEVIHAANTKWNFIPFNPGLVGGHCIGVDPYYLIHKSKMEGYNPKLLASAREINDFMPEYVVQSLLKLMIEQKLNLQEIRITVLGITFKENIPDLRNSKSMEIVKKLQQLGLSVQVCDPYVSQGQFEQRDKIVLKELDELDKANIVVLAVSHNEFKDLNKQALNSLLKDNQGIVMDLKGIIPKDTLQESIIHWTL